MFCFVYIFNKGPEVKLEENIKKKKSSQSVSEKIRMKGDFTILTEAGY